MNKLDEILRKLLGHDDSIEIGNGYHDDCAEEIAEARQAIVEAVEGIYGDSDGLREFAGLNLIKSVPEALEMYQKALADIERYRLIFGEIPATYGKVDVMTAFKTYRENESFHQNFGRYMEALKAKLEVTDLQLKAEKPSVGHSKAQS